MNTYNIFYIILLILVFIENFKKKISDLYFKIIIFILLVLIACRYEVGPDYFSYREIFNLPKENIEYLEKGYVYLNLFIKQQFGNFQILVAVMSLLMIYFLYKGVIFFGKNKKIFLLFEIVSLMGLYYFFAVYRQGLAILIAFYALKYLYTDEKYKYFIFILLASLFHKSIFFILPIALISSKNIKKKYMLMIFLGSILLGQLIGLRMIIKMLYVNLGFYNPFLKVIYFYLENKGEGLDYGLTPLFLLNKIVVLSLILLYKNKILRLNKKHIYIINFSFYEIIVYIIFSTQPLLASRISDIFIIYTAVLFALILLVEKRNIKILLFIFFLLYGTYFYERELYSVHPYRNVYSYLPYKFNFFNKK